MIPFNKPYMTGQELEYIRQAHERGALAGSGHFTRLCEAWLEKRIGSCKVNLTHSCTAALEMVAILADIQPGDEVILPSYTFVSTANAFVLRGATPVFVDIRQDTLNIDEQLIEGAITEKTKIIVPVHYAGVGCEMEVINLIAQQYNLLVVEDAAQGLMAEYKGHPLGPWGDFGTVSFHETKNVISGEGGALLVNNPDYAARAEIIWEKGTNRSQFFRGQVDKYSWVDIGSSYLPGEIIAAFLLAQLESADEITKKRLAIWDQYHEGFAALEARGLVRRPIIPEESQHNAHMYYLLVENLAVRTALMQYLKENEVHTVFHYVPLHSSPAGRRYGRISRELPVTDSVSDSLLRLPLFVGFEDAPKVIDLVYKFFALKS